MIAEKKNKAYYILVGLIFVVPLINFRFLIDVNLLRIAVFNIILAILLLVYWANGTENKIYLDARICLYAIIFPLVLICSALFNSSFIIALNDIVQLLSLITFLLFIIILLGTKQENEFDFIYFIAKIISFIVFVVALLGILQAFNIEVVNLASIVKPGSTLVSRNFASAYVVSALPFVLLAGKVVNSRKKNIYYSIFLLVVFYLLLLRGRTALVILFEYMLFGIIKIISYEKKKQYFIKSNLAKATIFVIIIIAGIFISLPGLSRKSFLSTIKTIPLINNRFNVGRITSWEKSILMIKDNPICGTGVGNWANIFPNYDKEYYSDYRVNTNRFINPHNDYLEFWAEAGVFALIIFLLFDFWILKILYVKSKEKDIYYYLLLSFIAILTISVFSFPHDRISTMSIFYLIGGIAFANSNNGKKIGINGKILFPVLLLFALIGSVYFSLKVESELLYIKALKYKFNEDYSDALNEFKKVNKIVYPVDEASSPIEYYEGAVSFALGKYNEAEDFFYNALVISPFNPFIINNLASTKVMLKKYKDAESIYLKLKKEYPNYIEPQVNLVAMYLNIGEVEKARKIFVRLEKLIGHKKINNNELIIKIKEYFYEK